MGQGSKFQLFKMSLSVKTGARAASSCVGFVLIEGEKDSTLNAAEERERKLAEGEALPWTERRGGFGN